MYLIALNQGRNFEEELIGPANELALFPPTRDNHGDVETEKEGQGNVSRELIEQSPVLPKCHPRLFR